MGQNSKIEWTDHTFSPWLGCSKVSPACDHCYAEAWAKRSGLVEWGNHPRRRTSAAYWRQPLKWNREAAAAGVRKRVFCCSLADVFDNQVPDEWRSNLWLLIAQTPHLDWLLLTKRPQNIAKMLPTAHGFAMLAGNPWPWPNVWLGTTIENQEEADRRIPHLLATPAAKRFISAEPLLGPVDLTALPVWTDPRSDEQNSVNALTGFEYHPGSGAGGYGTRLDWIIAGGESGPGGRPMHPAWARSLRDQCVTAGVPFHFKQWGEWVDADQHLAQVRAQGKHLYFDEGDALNDGWQPKLPLSFDSARDLAAMLGGKPYEHQSDGTTLIRVGKKAAGRLLDGIEHNGFPA